MNGREAGRVIDPRTTAVDEPDRQAGVQRGYTSNHRVLGKSEILRNRSKPVLAT